MGASTAFQPTSGTVSGYDGVTTYPAQPPGGGVSLYPAQPPGGVSTYPAQPPGGGYQGFSPVGGIQPLAAGSPGISPWGSEHYRNPYQRYDGSAPLPPGNSPWGNQHYRNPYTQPGGSTPPPGNSPWGRGHYQNPLDYSGSTPPAGNSPWGRGHYQNPLGQAPGPGPGPTMAPRNFYNNGTVSTPNVGNPQRIANYWLANDGYNMNNAGTLPVGRGV